MILERFTRKDPCNLKVAIVSLQLEASIRVSKICMDSCVEITDIKGDLHSAALLTLMQ